MDVVSQRCQFNSSYKNLCGLKNYEILRTDGTQLPFDLIPVWNNFTQVYDLSAIITNESLADYYEVAIHSSFKTPDAFGNLADNF